VLLVALLALALLGALVWYLSTRYGSTPVEPITARPDANADAPPANAATTPLATPGVSAPAAETPTPTITPRPTVEATPLIEIQQQPAGPTPSPAPPGESTQVRLVVPVAGVRVEDLRDTYTQARSEGRTHNAIDIIAARGTPVVAAADGRVVKLFQSVPGGIAVYQLATDDRTILYYAHLDRYADGLAEGHFARQGETIGYVGDTGNAGPGNYHLHFSVSITSDSKRWYGGTNVNPYPLLTQR
jgi:murein DD-endopeptidase MepM/ murein hydrolase activator NlpD